MEDQNSSLFGLTIDNNTRAHLIEGARWAKFLAIVGFVMCGLFVIFALFAGTLLAAMTRGPRFGDSVDSTGIGMFLTIFYLGLDVLIFLPYLFLYRYSNHMKNALNTNDQERLNKSVQNLKIMFRYVGILTIIGLSFYLIAILMILSTTGIRS
jgi:uncharacterized membrane protein YjgN (DUF898 family)